MGPRGSFEYQHCGENLCKYTEEECLLGQMEPETYKDPKVQAKWIKFLNKQPVQLHGMKIMRPMLTGIIRGDV